MLRVQYMHDCCLVHYCRSLHIYVGGCDGMVTRSPTGAENTCRYGGNRVGVDRGEEGIEKGNI